MEVEGNSQGPKDLDVSPGGDPFDLDEVLGVHFLEYFCKGVPLTFLHVYVFPYSAVLGVCQGGALFRGTHDYRYLPHTHSLAQGPWTPPLLVPLDGSASMSLIGSRCTTTSDPPSAASAVLCSGASSDKDSSVMVRVCVCVCVCVYVCMRQTRTGV